MFTAFVLCLQVGEKPQNNTFSQYETFKMHTIGVLLYTGNPTGAC